MERNLAPPSARPPRPFRLAVVRGLAVLAPPLLTVLIILWAINTTKSYFLEPVTAWAREGIVWAIYDVRWELPLEKPGGRTAKVGDKVYHELDNGSFIPEHVYAVVHRQSGELAPNTGEGYFRRYVELTYLRPYLAIPFFLAVFVLVLYFLGKFMAAGIGRLVGNLFERFIARLPGVRAVYSGVKQVTDFLFSQRELKVTRVVAVQYPRQGVWSVGFVTGESLDAIHEVAGEPMLTVLIPYSPLPVTGCTITVRRSECIDLNMSFDQACQYIISCGVVVPAGQALGQQAVGDRL